MLTNDTLLPSVEGKLVGPGFGLLPDTIVTLKGCSAMMAIKYGCFLLSYASNPENYTVRIIHIDQYNDRQITKVRQYI